jgi:hypothetical protein
MIEEPEYRIAEQQFPETGAHLYYFVRVYSDGSGSLVDNEAESVEGFRLMAQRLLEACDKPLMATLYQDAGYGEQRYVQKVGS